MKKLVEYQFNNILQEIKGRSKHFEDIFYEEGKLIVTMIRLGSYSIDTLGNSKKIDIPFLTFKDNGSRWCMYVPSDIGGRFGRKFGYCYSGFYE